MANLYDGKTFRPLSNTPNGEVADDTRFHYHQSGTTVWAEYAGSAIAKGHLIALVVDDAGTLDMRYHHVNTKGDLMTGRCRSVPQTLPDGRLQLHETWQWTSGDGSSGTSVLEEVKE
jgi:hypothetical protein